MRILSVLLLVLPLAAFGEDVTYLVRDLPGLTIHDSLLYEQKCFWTNTGNITWFMAMTASGGLEIFKTDGTSAGTVQVTHGVGVPASNYNGPFLGIVNGKLIYGGVDAAGSGVFALDTNGGDPVLLGRFQLASLTNAVVQGDTLYFSARDAASTYNDLWRTSGTPLTTARFVLPAFDAAGDQHLYSAGKWVYFFAGTALGTGLFRTDGTIENTLLLLPLPANTLAQGLTGPVASLGNQLLFSFISSPNVRQLWATDGTTAGTIQIAAPQVFTPLGVLDGKLFFGDSTGIWSTDGTAAGTRKTADAPVDARAGHVVGNRMFFGSGAGLWVTDGTAAATHLIMPMNQAFPSEGFDIGNFYYFSHDDGVHGIELWRTDGTSAEIVADINPGYRNGVDNGLAFKRPDGKVLFAATNYNYGREPWITDGTNAGTQLLKNIAADDPLGGSSPAQLGATGSKLFFTANLNAGPALGTSDGTSGGTTATVLEIPSIYGGVAANGRYFFRSPTAFYASDGTAAGTTPIFQGQPATEPLPNGVAFADDGGDLWFSDGTVAGTRKLRSFGRFPGIRLFEGGSLVWLTHGSELWKTDGSDAGTVRVVLNPAPTYIDQVFVSGSSIYFTDGAVAEHGDRLWRAGLDGSGATVMHDFGYLGTGFIAVVDHMVYLIVDGVLYRSDGTASGTIPLPVENPCPATGVLGDALLFTSVTVPDNGLILWRSDGTVAGTQALHVMRPPSRDAGCSPMAVRGNKIFYRGWDAEHGWELWQSDGTVSGTHLTADIYPGPQSSLPLELTLAGDRLFFSADSPNTGRELWAVGPFTPRHRGVRP